MFSVLVHQKNHTRICLKMEVWGTVQVHSSRAVNYYESNLTKFADVNCFWWRIFKIFKDLQTERQNKIVTFSFRYLEWLAVTYCNVKFGFRPNVKAQQVHQIMEYVVQANPLWKQILTFCFHFFWIPIGKTGFKSCCPSLSLSSLSSSWVEGCPSYGSEWHSDLEGILVYCELSQFWISSGTQGQHSGQKPGTLWPRLLLDKSHVLRDTPPLWLILQRNHQGEEIYRLKCRVCCCHWNHRCTMFNHHSTTFLPTTCMGNEDALSTKLIC